MSLASGSAQQFLQARLQLYEISHVQAERRVLVQNTAPLSELKTCFDALKTKHSRFSREKSMMA
ncbi:hypothetical protein EJB05_38673, partial [Eragrostis curvula]